MTGLAIIQPPLLQPNGDVLTSADGQAVELDSLTMIALETVWVPGPPKLDSMGRPIPIRGSALGPNGEGPDEGRWRLRLAKGCPAHLGKAGEIYNGPTLSASSTETFSECAQKWALEKLANLTKPPNRKAEMGGERHLELNRWLVYGTMPTTSGMSKVIAHFPMPGQCASEEYFGFVFGRPGHEVVIAGYIDAREMPMVRETKGRNGVVDAVVDELGVYSVQADIPETCEWCDKINCGCKTSLAVRGPLNPIVRDLKTTGDFRWKKTGAQLKVNLQAGMYALDSMLRSNRDVALLKWTYGQIKEPGDITRVETVNEEDSSSKPEECSGVFLTKREAVATVARYVVQYGEAMISAIQRGARAEEMPKNVDACSLYGGCPWLKTEPQACVPPPGGGGFRSMLAKERVRLGILTGESTQKVAGLLPEPREMTTAAGLGNRFAARMKAGPPLEQKPEQMPEKKMSALANRFAKTKTTPAVVNAPVTTNPSSSPTTPVAKSPSALARFAPKGGSVARPVVKAPTPPAEETPKLEIKATVDGNASGGGAQVPAAPSVEPGSLLERLQAMQPGNAQNIAAAMTTAPSNSVTLSAAEKSKANSIGAMAYGINPPDAAPEWTDEEQDEEAERIAKRSGVGGEVKEKKTPILEALPASSPTREAAAMQAQTQLEAKAEVKAEKEQAKAALKEAKEAAKLAGTAPRRGRPPGSKNQDTKEIDGVVYVMDGSTKPLAGSVTFDPTMAAISIEGAIALLDDLTIALVAGKQRAAAARIADAVAALELIQAAQEAAADSAWAKKHAVTP